MQRMYTQLLKLLAGLLFIFPLLYDVVIVPAFQISTRLVTVLKVAPFHLSGEFVMSITFLLFITGAGICYFVMEELLL